MQFTSSPHNQYFHLMFMFNVGGKEPYGLLAQGCCYNISLGPSSTVRKGKKNLLSHPLFSFFLTVEPGPRLLQGAKKIVFTACHSGKLKLAFTSPDVISTSPKNFCSSVNQVPHKTSLARRAS